MHEILGDDQTYGGMLDGYSSERVQRLKEATFEVETLARHSYSYERPDYWTIEINSGVREQGGYTLFLRVTWERAPAGPLITFVSPGNRDAST